MGGSLYFRQGFGEGVGKIPEINGTSSPRTLKKNLFYSRKKAFFFKILLGQGKKGFFKRTRQRFFSPDLFSFEFYEMYFWGTYHTLLI